MTLADGKRSRRGHNKGDKYKDGPYYIEALSLGYTTNKQGKRVRARKYFHGKTRREAEEKKNRWLREHERGEQARAKGIDVDRHRVLFADFVAEWLSTSVTGKVKPSTESNYRHVLHNHLLPAFGDRPLNETRPQAVERMLRHKQTELKPSTLKMVLTVLRTILNTAVRWRYIERNPASDVRHDFGDTHGDRRHLSKEQEAALFAQEMDPWGRNLYRLAIDTGLRQGELLALQWKDINLERGILMVTRNPTRSKAVYDVDGNKTERALQFSTPKTAGGIRIVPFPPASAAALRDQHTYVEQLRATARSRADHDLVFPSRVGTPLTPNTVGDRFRRRRDAAGITGAVFHSFRHTATTRLMLDNIPHPIAMGLLGHKNIDTTMLYTHASEGDLIETMRLLCVEKRAPR